MVGSGRMHVLSFLPAVLSDSRLGMHFRDPLVHKASATAEAEVWH